MVFSCFWGRKDQSHAILGIRPFSFYCQRMPANCPAHPGQAAKIVTFLRQTSLPRTTRTHVHARDTTSITPSPFLALNHLSSLWATSSQYLQPDASSIGRLSALLLTPGWCGVFCHENDRFTADPRWTPAASRAAHPEWSHVKIAKILTQRSSLA